MRFPRHKLLYAVNCSTTLSISPASSASPSLKLHSHLMQNSLMLPIPNQNTTIDSSQLFQQSFSLLPLAYSALDTVLALCWAVQPKGNNCVYIGVGSNSVVPNCQWHMEVNLDNFLLGTSLSVSAAGQGIFIVQPTETRLVILDRASTGKQIQKESKRHWEWSKYLFFSRVK